LNKVLVIAEAGVNHNGDVVLAKEMIESAKLAGADIVKFQTFRAENLASPYAKKADYQKYRTRATENQLQMLRKLELNKNDYVKLLTHCKKLGIQFLSTAFDLDSLLLLKRLGLSLFKIPSGEITNYPYLKQIASYRKSLILSTGMATLGEVENALNVLLKYGTSRNKITVLHCNTEYPTPFEDVNLHAMCTIGNAFGVKYGYSDHTNGIEIPIAAVALGASVIEKHFTLDRNMKGPDHKASLEPNELKDMITAIRHIEVALGNNIKTTSPSEEKNKIVVRKSIVAKCSIKKGEILSERNLSVKRPGNGISPMRWNDIIGRQAIRAFKENELIEI
jgi:N,N'-diacetyllegionaminate synthase